MSPEKEATLNTAEHLLNSELASVREGDFRLKLKV